MWFLVGWMFGNAHEDRPRRPRRQRARTSDPLERLERKLDMLIDVLVSVGATAVLFAFNVWVVS